MPTDVQSSGRGYGLSRARRYQRRHRERPVSRSVAPGRSTEIPVPRVSELPGPGSRPLQRQRREARRQVVRAQTPLPKRPTPTIPVIRRPTIKQREAALGLIHRNTNQQAVDGRARTEQAQRLAELRQEILKDPKQGQYRRTIRYYRDLPDPRGMEFYGRQAAELAEPGSGRKLSRAQAIRLGEQTTIAKIIRDGARGLRPGREPSRIRALGLNIKAPDIGKAIAAVTTLDQGDIGPRQFAGNALRDVKTIATAPFIGGYELGAAAFEGVRDRPALLAGGPAGLAAGVALSERGQRLAKGVAEGAAESVPGQLVQGDFEGAVEAFREHPLIAALDVGAVGAIGGRAAGALARGLGSQASKGGLRGAFARAGSTVRPPLALGDDIGAGLVARDYSKDLSRKSVQVANDARREPLRDADGNIVTVTERGVEVPVLKASPREAARLLRREGDFDASRAALENRYVRGRGEREHRVRGRSRGVPRRARDIVQRVTEGTVLTARSFENDLRGYADRVARMIEEEDRAPGSVFSDRRDLQDAQRNLAQVEKVLADPKVLAKAEEIVREGERHGRMLREGDRQKLAAGVSEERQLNRAALSVVALEHMGARHFTVREHRQLERQALAEENAARARVQAAGSTAERDAALAELREARERRIAVSGRDPRGVVAHERAQAAAANASRRVVELGGELRRLRERRARVAGRQEVQRGREGREGPLRVYKVGDKRFKSRKEAEAYRKKNGGKIEELALTGREARRMGARAQLDRRIAALEKEYREARKKARELRGVSRRTKLPQTRAGLRTSEGRFLPDRAIEEFARSRGRDPGTIAHVPHRSSRDAEWMGRRARYQQVRPGTRPRDNGPSRTGALYLRGSAESSAELLREHGVSQRVQVHKARAIDRSVRDRGMRHPAWGKAQRGQKLTKHERQVVRQGGYFTPDEAERAIRRLESDTGRRYVAVKAFNVRMSEETLAAIQAGQAPGAMDSLGQRLLNDRFLREGDYGSRARNVVLMPAEYVERLMEHLRPSGPVQRTLQYVNKFFRFAVLPQPRWLTGQFVEPFVVRLTTVGSGVNVFGLALDIAATNRMLHEMERSGDRRLIEAARAFRAQHLSGMYGGGRGLTVRRTAGEIPGLSRVYGAIVSRMPWVESMAQLIAMLPKAFFAANWGIESTAQRAALGRSVRRDLQEFTGSWLQTVRLGREALREVAEGLTNTRTQARFIREQYKLLGKYDGYSPWMRNVIQGAMPFVPWVLSAARFTFWTMPAQRTVQTALLVKTADVVQRDWQELHANTPPGGLRLAIPTRDGGWIDLARYTPWGLSGPLLEGDAQILTSQFFPQLQGAVSALEGRDPFGRALKVKPTEGNPEGRPNLGQKFGVALNSALEAVVPGLSTARRLQEGGGTPYADSNVFSPKTKPGTTRGEPSFLEALSRVFNPLRPVYLGGRPSVAAGGPPAPRSRSGWESPAGVLSPEQEEALDRAFERIESSAMEEQDEALRRAFARLGG